MAGFDVQGARAAGYSDAEIADHLGQEAGYDVGAARKAGYSDADLIAHIAGPDQADPTAAAVAERRAMPKPLRMVDAGMRGAADMLSLGFGDELSAGVQAIPSLFTGGTDGYGKAFDRYVARERAVDAADKQDVPVSRGVGEVGGFGLGLGAGAVADAGRLIPRLARGGFGSVAENALRSAGMGALYGGGAAAGNATGDVPQRLEAAVPGAVVGGVIGGVASPVVDALGVGANMLRMRNAPPLTRAANALTGRFDVAAAQARAQALRDAGADPAAVSAMDESGRGYVRAAASRMTPGREIVQQRAEGAALNLPDRIAMQARQHISPNPANVDAVTGQLEQARGAQAATDYAQPYAEQLEVPPDVQQMLSDPAGRAIIARARADAVERQDAQAQAELASLLAPNAGGQLPTVSGATLDRLAMAARERGVTLARRGANYRAGGAFGRQGQINEVLDNTPGLADARGAYAEHSRNIDAATAADGFLAPGSTDEFAAATGAATDLNPARQVAARRVEMAVGENPSAAPGVARKLAYASEQQARNAALLGPEGAQALQNSMGAEARVARDMSDVAPRSGSQTQPRSQDAAQASAVVDFAHAVATGGRSVVVGLLSRLKTAGISDADAHAVADIATDPRQLDALLSRMDQMRPGMGQHLRAIIQQSASKDAGEATQPAVMMTDAQGNVYDYSGKIIGHGPTPAEERNALR